MDVKNPYNAVIIKGFNKDNSESVRGTAFFINENTLITAEHLFKDDYSYYFYLSPDDLSNDIKHSINKIIINEDIDIALFSTNTIVNITEQKLCISSIEKHMEITSYGFPIEKKNLPAEIKSEMISDLRNISSTPYCYEIVQCKNNIVTDYRGMSGAPIAIEGYIVGMLLFQQKSNTLYCVSFEKINEFITNANIGLALNYSDYQELNYKSPGHPEYPFISIYSSPPQKTIARGLGIKFSYSQWHIKELLANSTEWILDYALTHSQKLVLQQKPMSVYKDALKTFTNGNLNILLDLFLHMTIRKNYKTIPVINKAFIVGSSEIFSCSHIIINQKKIELWLGVSCFHNNGLSALNSAYTLVKELFTIEKLGARFKIITEEIPETWPYNEKLHKLKNNSLSLEKRVDKIIIPLFLTYESNGIINYDESTYEETLTNEIDAICNSFENDFSHDFIDKVNIRIFIFPAKELNNLYPQFQEVLNEQ